MRIFLLILRIGVFVLALGGAGIAGYVGYLDYDNVVQKNQLETAQKKQAAARALAGSGLVGAEEQRKIENGVEERTGQARLYPFLLAGAVLGLAAAVLAVMGRTTSAGVLLLLAGLGPAAVVPFSLLIDTLVITSLLTAAGLGALFVSFLAFVTQPRPHEDDDLEDDEDPTPLAAKRRARFDEEEEQIDEEIDEAPPPRAGSKRSTRSDDEEPEPPARTGAGRKR